MQELLRDYLGELRSKRRKRRRISVAVTLLIVMVAGGVIGALVQYGVAMTGDAKCGIEEHTHSDECYENVLACGQEESEGHTHTDDCYQTNSTLACGLEESEEHVHGEECYVNEQVLICGQEEGEGHTHTDSCYDKQLACGKEEHIHTDACYIDTTADVEESSDWDAQYKDTEWKDAWGEDLVTAAKVQVGYKESTKNYTVAADESHKGYTRYGQFAGDVYADWDAMFVNFCMHYAGLEASNLFPNEKTAVEWYNKFVQVSETNLSYITAPEGYEPKVGDLIFFNREEENEFRMGVVSSYNKEKNEIKVIEGNSENEVKENEYDTDDEYIYAYLKITELETAYKDKGEEDSSAEVTEQPADGDEQDPQDEITEEEGDPQDEITEEEEELQDEKIEEEEWAYEESYDADKVIVHVKAKEGVIPEGAELSVTPIEKKEITDDMSKKEKKEAEKVNEQYEMTSEKLSEESEKNEQKLEGFLAYDICFLVDGEEVEPDGEVQVTMDFKEAVVPEEVSKDATVAVNHLKESEDGKVTVENLTEVDTTTIQTAKEDASVEKVELVADSFSIFTIRWYLGGTSYPWGQLEVEYIDENENQLEPIGVPSDIKFTLEEGKEYVFKEEIGWNPITVKEDGKNVIYSPIKIQIIYEGKPVEVSAIKYENFQWIFISPSKLEGIAFAPGMTNILQIVYRRLYIAEIQLENNIETTGNLDANPIGSALEQYETANACNKDDNQENDQEIRYVWYKKVNETDYVEVDIRELDNDTSKISGDYGNSLNVALDEGALNEDRQKVEYKVELYIGDKLVGRSAPESILFYNELQNGSFENPDITSEVGAAHWGDIEQSKVPGWKTTAKNTKDSNVGSYDIEIARVYNEVLKDEYGSPVMDENGNPKYFPTIAPLYNQGGSFEAADGMQFAELNAESIGALYQDVLTARGVPLNYHLAHRARCTTGPDKQDNMYLVIVPTYIAKQGINKDNDEIDTWEEVGELLKNKEEKDENGELKYPGVYVENYTAVTTEWREHDGVYVPEYDLNRFFFVSNERNHTTEGNFLDDVWFSQKLPKPKEHSFNFGIEKTIKGLDVSSIEELKEKIALLEFEITVPDMQKEALKGDIPRTVKAADMIWTKTSDGYTGVKYYYDIPLGSSQGYQITVEEKNADIESYGLVTTVTPISSGISGETVKGTSGQVLVQNQSRERLLFTNIYGEKNNSSWTVIKRSFSDKITPLEGANFTLSTSLVNASEDKRNLGIVATGISNGEGIISWKIPNTDTEFDISKLDGDYILSESKAPEGYYQSGKEWKLHFDSGKLDVGALQAEIDKETEEKSFIHLEENGDDYVISIYNTRIYSLPSTGGSGIYWYMFSGILLMAGTTLITYKKRCREVLRS